MNKAQNLDELDIQLYAIMPLTKSKDVDAYNSADPNQISERNSKKVLRRIKREIKYIESHEKYRPAIETWKRVALFVLVMMSLAFASIITVEATRNAIWKVISVWYEERIHLQYVGEENAYAPETLLEYKEPTVSDGYERYVGMENEYVFLVEYENSTSLITYQQSILENYEVWLSNHDSESSAAEINGNRGELTSYVINGTDYNTIVWTDDVYAYSLSGNIELNELIRIAETVD